MPHCREGGREGGGEGGREDDTKHLGMFRFLCAFLLVEEWEGEEEEEEEEEEEPCGVYLLSL